MPRYHFHTADGRKCSDDEGVELAGDGDAKQQAVKFAGQMVGDNPDELWRDGQFRIEVTNDDNALLWTIITLAVEAPRPR